LVQVEIWPLRFEARDWAACGKQSPANKRQNHIQPATPPKSLKLHANTFNILNFKKWPVTAIGGNVGGVRGGGREILRICTGNSDRNFIKENRNQLLSNMYILVETQSLQSWRK
jgi:hypothetical protein